MTRVHPNDVELAGRRRPCKTCNALPGEWCHGPTGAPTQHLHAPRWDAGARETGKWQPAPGGLGGVRP